MTPFEFYQAIKRGKTSKKGWKEFVSTINRLKLTDSILEGIHLGLSKLPDKDAKKFFEK